MTVKDDIYSIPIKNFYILALHLISMQDSNKNLHSQK